ncbi:TNT domain-containing protein [Thermomonospora amylolytica]|uniref:TNT domain-containing protein n=1 Tax=Thermomonospora amylolytica TaxID=1411117 RepID=UPI000E6D1614|nr:TNT domain-containing protein [Thermomonospora amylolytica]
MALTHEEQRDRLDDLATLLIHLMPGGWEEAELRYFAWGDHRQATLDGTMVDARRLRYPIYAAGELLPRSGAFELLDRLRADMYRPEDGAWVSLYFRVRSGHGRQRWRVRVRYLDDLGWQSRPPAAEIAAELARYPRPDDLVPEWARYACMLHEAAESFDPRTVLAAPQSEQRLLEQLGRDDPQLFVQARAILRDYAHEAAERLLIGRLAPGAWSLVRAEPAWLAVRYDDGGEHHVVPFGDARSALAHAMGGLLAEAGTEVNTEVLSAGRLIARNVDHMKGWSAWRFGDNYGHLHVATRHSPRPPASQAEGDSYIALEQFNNRPYEYFVCQPGPPPETGAYASVRQIFEAVARHRLPRPREIEEPPSEPRLETIPVGTEVDSYGDHDTPFVYRIGTPFTRRDLRGGRRHDDYHAYHVYRVVRPLQAYLYVIEPWPFHPGEDDPAEEWGGWYLDETIEELIRTGYLVEITGPGGEPIEPIESTGRRTDENEGTDQ